MSADGIVRIEPDSSGKAIDTGTFTRDGVQVYRQRVEAHQPAIGQDAAGRTRVAQISTLFDGKTLRAENALMWDTAGTGTATFEVGTIKLAVTAGQYLVRQSRMYAPYFSGKAQLAEITFDNFAPEAGLIKRYGYFSSSAVAPYTANFDGTYVEADDNTHWLVVVNDGTEVLRIRRDNWDCAPALEDYDWDNFTVSLVDFLWLGGAVLRLFIKDPAGGFILAHTYNHAGSAAGTFMRSPNQPLRYEIRSTVGAGHLRAICGQIASEGSISESGQPLALRNSALVSANVVGTIYALKGVRKVAAYRDIPIRVHSVGGGVSTSDSGLLLLLRNPTLSAPMTWAANSMIEEGTATNQTVTNVGRILHATPLVSAGVADPFVNNTLAWLSTAINDATDDLVLAYQPLTVQQSVVGVMNLVEY
jgi:hypothetical protein